MAHQAQPRCSRWPVIQWELSKFTLPPGTESCHAVAAAAGWALSPAPQMVPLCCTEWAAHDIGGHLAAGKCQVAP